MDNASQHRKQVEEVMTINLSIPASHEMKPRITVIGVGGAGGNAVNNMITSHLEGVEFVVCNTDAQALAQSLTERRVQIGVTITQGLGAGSRPDVGKAAAEEALDELMEHVQGSHMVFITAGMGGGTGTGAAPVIARAARENGILTVGVVTKPFQFEGSHRMNIAEHGIIELQQYVDTLIIIPNQNLFRIANENTTFADAFKMADNVLHSGVRGVTDLMVMPGLINLDFADVRAVMSEMGKAMMGTGESEGETRATEAAEAAISNPLLDDVSMRGARGVLINITGGSDMTLFEVDEAANRIRDEVDPDANIIFGSTFDDELAGKMRVSVVATGIDADIRTMPRPLIDASERLTLISGGADASDAADNTEAEPAVPSVAGFTQTVSFKPPRAEQPQAAEPTEAAEAADTEAFIPPPPVDPARAAPPPAAPLTADGREAKRSKTRGPSLFERMTGGALSRRGQSEAKRQKEVVPPPPPPAPPPAATVQPPPPVMDMESGLDQDVLDIPAFLRRQAN